MIKNICIVTFLLAQVISYSGCPHMHQNLVYNQKPIEHIYFVDLIDLNSSIYIYVTPRIIIDAYESTFIDVFTNGEGFSHYLRTELEKKLDIVFDENHQSEIVEPLQQLDLSGNNSFYDELKSLVTYNSIDYLIFIEFATITSVWNPGAPEAGFISYCCVKYEVQVIKVNDWEITNQFRVSGVDQLGSFYKEEELKKAANISIENAINYLKENDISNPDFQN